MRASVMLKAVLLSVFSLLVLTGCPTETPPAETDGGTDHVLCTSDTECPADLPKCEAGVCVEDTEGNCTADEDCPGSTCNQITGKCDPCDDCCASEDDCEAGFICAEHHCVVGGNPCTSVDECEAGQICQGDKCVGYDATAACTTDADCPRDHVCNALGDGSCQGCINDTDCIDSVHGPKCDLTDDGVGPGPGYCYVECGPGLPECPTAPSEMVCDEDRGGICVAGCTTRADCEEGLICLAGYKCAPCESSSQCDVSEICSDQGTCVENPGCMDGDTDLCIGRLGAAYFCNQTTNQCQLGCTEGGCDTNDSANCNPCPEGVACAADTHECTGGCPDGCLDPMTGAPSDCAAMGLVCDSVTCQCTVPGGQGSGNGGAGDACINDTDCQSGYVCEGGMAMLGLPGACYQSCSQSNMCACDDPALTCRMFNSETIGTVACLLGARGVCQGDAQP